MKATHIVNSLLEDDEDDFDVLAEIDNLPNVIPHPDNPFHVDNLRSVRLLGIQGFEGTDASLEESLFEYGIAWRELPDKWLFVYAIPGSYRRFERAAVDKDVDLVIEYNWVDWPNFLLAQGDDIGEADDPREADAAWFKNRLPWKIADLANYYGVENVFGSAYSSGFRIDSDDSDGEVPFNVKVFDATGPWGKLRIFASSEEEARERAVQEMRDAVDNRDTEIDLNTMRLEVEAEAPN